MNKLAAYLVKAPRRRIGVGSNGTNQLLRLEQCWLP